MKTVDILSILFTIVISRQLHIAKKGLILFNPKRHLKPKVEFDTDELGLVLKTSRHVVEYFLFRIKNRQVLVYQGLHSTYLFIC